MAQQWRRTLTLPSEELDRRPRRLGNRSIPRRFAGRIIGDEIEARVVIRVVAGSLEAESIVLRGRDRRRRLANPQTPREAAKFQADMQWEREHGRKRSVDPLQAQELIRDLGDHMAAIAGAWSYLDPEGGEVEVDDVRQSMQKRQARRVMTEEHLQEVAMLYRQAMDLKVAPRQYVAQHWHVATSTAARWIAECRKPERGYLGPTTPGRRGEHAEQVEP